MKKLILALVFLAFSLIGFSQITNQLVVEVEKEGIDIELNNGMVLKDSLFIVIPPYSTGFQEWSKDTVNITITFEVYQSKEHIDNYFNHNYYSAVLQRTFTYRTNRAFDLSTNDIFVQLRNHIKDRLSDFDVQNSDIKDITDEF